MSKKVVIIIAALVVVLMGAMGAGFYLLWQKMSDSIAMVQNQNQAQDAAGSGKAAGPSDIGPVYRLETMIVNLADQGGKRYLRITMEFELDSPKTVAELEQRLPQLRNTILMILPTREYTDICTTEGKIALRDEIISEANTLLKSGKIVTIYFTEFVIQ